MGENGRDLFMIPANALIENFTDELFSIIFFCYT